MAPVSSDVWGRLMTAAQGGDRIAYRLLLDELRSWLTRYYRRRLPMDMVDDAVQEALLAVHNKRASYDPARAFAPWLAAIARYKWIDRLRTMSAHPTQALPEGEWAGDPALVVGDTGDAVVSAAVLRELLATLKPGQAAAIRLVKIDGHSIDEAALLTGQSAALVKVNIHRGLAKLAARIEGHDDVE
ncbi:MAG: sigma-70 family RNA polymerase sigma factor [Polymorphobacter sp.]